MLIVHAWLEKWSNREKKFKIQRDQIWKPITQEKEDFYSKFYNTGQSYIQNSIFNFYNENYAQYFYIYIS